MSAPLSTVSLAGTIVRLDPLTLAHAAPLAEVGLHPELWALQPRPVETEVDMRRYVELALDDQARGVSLPFSVVHRGDERVIGSTRYMDIAMVHRRLEIGATWIAPAWQRSGANVEAKLLLLAHAFETLGVQKVVFKTETLNAQSRRAILALGAVEEGTFRKHLIADNGRVRDMVYFSILDTEWPAARDRLRERLQRHVQPQPNT
ncbi:MAG: GNAT family protein [Mizugakiibacter sp.]|uniref:GNAT family N-acetyltransferase n=1 Tax=Mizugakiibacter sp. TaxID=1972610 RepID=UPI0031C79D92|nr:GNAT family N-acetyltransferase [Xanthomonadaceae bacterium]